MTEKSVVPAKIWPTFAICSAVYLSAIWALGSTNLEDVVFGILLKLANFPLKGRSFFNGACVAVIVVACIIRAIEIAVRKKEKP